MCCEEFLKLKFTNKKKLKKSSVCLPAEIFLKSLAGNLPEVYSENHPGVTYGNPKEVIHLMPLYYKDVQPEAGSSPCV